MPRITWNLVTTDQMHGLVAAIDPSFFGGEDPNDRFDSKRVREAVNLMVRLAQRLKMPGTYSMAPARGPDQNLVLCAFEREADRDTVANMVAAQESADERRWLSCRRFDLTEAAHEELLKVAGESDKDSVGRKRRRDEQKQQEEPRLRW